MAPASRYDGLWPTTARYMCRTSPADIAPILALRPLVEAAILTKWISLDPTLHGELWFAHAEDRELTGMREQERHLGVRVRGDIPVATITETVEQKAAFGEMRRSGRGTAEIMTIGTCCAGTPDAMLFRAFLGVIVSTFNAERYPGDESGGQPTA